MLKLNKKYRMLDIANEFEEGSLDILFNHFIRYYKLDYEDYTKKLDRMSYLQYKMTYTKALHNILNKHTSIYKLQNA